MTYVRTTQKSGAVLVGSQAELDALSLPNGSQVFRTDVSTLYIFKDGVPEAVAGEASSVSWGSITGDVNSQPDLDTYLQEIVPIAELVPLLDEDYNFLTTSDKIDGGQI